MNIQDQYGPKKIAIIGDVDNGKSTLIGQILYSSGSLLDDQKLELKNTTTDKKINLASITDGLKEEREKGITIDVSHRFLSLHNQRYMFYDCPGHSEFIQNMITASSNVNICLILVDAVNGVTEQLKKHLEVIKLMRVENLIFCVNKMDLLNFKESYFLDLKKEILSFIDSRINHITLIPISAGEGDNVLLQSDRMNWYKGPSVVKHLESVLDEFQEQKTPYFLTQGLVKDNLVLGEFSCGKMLKNIDLYNPISKIIYKSFPLEGKSAEQRACVLKFETVSGLNRGDVLVPLEQKIMVSKTLCTKVYWFSKNTYSESKEYKLLHLNKQYLISSFKFKLTQTETFDVEVTLVKPLAYLSYEESRTLGRIVFIEKDTNKMVGFGVID